MIARHGKKIGTALLVIVVILAAAIRIACVMQTNGIIDHGFLERAWISEESAETGSSDYVLEEVYIRLLRGIFFVMGNLPVMGLYAQIALEVLGILFVFLAVKKLSGIIPALVSGLLLSVYPLFLNNINELSVVSVFLLLYGIMFLLFGRTYSGGYINILSYLFLGIFTGLLTYSDICFAVFLLLELYVFVKPHGKLDPPFKRPVMLFLYMLIGNAAGFLSCIGLKCFYNAMDAGEAISGWLSLFLPKGISDYGVDAKNGIIAVNVILALLFVLILLYSVLWAIASRIPVGAKAEKEKEKEEKTIEFEELSDKQETVEAIENAEAPVSEETVLDSEEPVKSVEPAKPEEPAKVEEPLKKEKHSLFKKKDKKAKQDKAEIRQDFNSGVYSPENMKGTKGEKVTVEIDGEKKEVQLLDNPMKLPKKKETYNFMDYDYDVPDDDDFDI